ncbi:mast/stem cell growth factor receptor kita-like [Huso huso]|uniref:Mast/stem cell growth factor receptor n=1 Tax=Huso huso TaxID=61971 RepID=A0ABR1AAY9_HUSHU
MVTMDSHWGLLLTLVLLGFQQGLAKPVIKPSLSSLVVIKGGKIELRCQDNTSVQWFLERSRRINLKRNIKMEGGYSKIVITNVEPRNMGRYICISNNPSLESSIYVFVKDPENLFYPSIVTDLSVKEGEDPAIRCLVTDPEVTDFKLERCGDNPLPKDLKFIVDFEKGITIKNAQKSFEGCYICSAKHNGGKIWKSKSYHLKVYPAQVQPPALSLDEVKVILKEGEVFEVKCKALNVDHEMEMKWNYPKNATPIKKNNSRSKLNVFEMESTLHIASVNTTDSGNYTCEAKNHFGSSSASMLLNVLETGFINMSIPGDRTVEVNTGESLILPVEFTAYPRPDKLFWMYMNVTLQNGSDHFITSEENGYRYSSNLNLVRLTGTEGGNYKFVASSSDTSSSKTFTVHVRSKPEIISQDGPINGIVRCIAAGYPVPEVSWYYCLGPHKRCFGQPNATKEEGVNINLSSPAFGRRQIESRMNVSKLHTNITLECLAQSDVGQDYYIFRIEIEERTVAHELFTPLLIGFVAAAAVLCVILAILIYKYSQKPKYRIQWKVIEGMNGNNYVYIDPAQLPYDHKWEFPRDKLRFGKTLGSGAFGKVVEATAYGMSKADSVMTVAVKMLKPSAHSTEKEALMSELKVLSYLGHHMNIVNLLGACTVGGPILVITEYCCYGDLLNFLRRKRDLFFCSSFVEESHYRNILSEAKSDDSKNGYMTMRPSMSGASPLKSTLENRRSVRKGSYSDKDNEMLQDDTMALDTEDLLSISYQVAKGMSFLASKNCIHRDLAARNILITPGRVAKICDFGLARDIKNDSNYVVKGNARLPVKWMAPESIFECVYTFESDVWSYGILLWELFSLGSSPYPGMPVDSKFYKMIKEGYRMVGPEFAPDEMCDIMKACWDADPLERPSFGQIVEKIEQQLSDNTKHIYLNFSTKFSNTEDLAAHSLRLNSVGSSNASTQPLLLGDDVFFEDEQRQERA